MLKIMGGIDEISKSVLKLIYVSEHVLYIGYVVSFCKRQHFKDDWV